MSWRTVVITQRAKLDLQMGYLVIRMDKITKIHLSEINTVLIDSPAVSLTTSLLAELSRKKIKVIFCDEKRLPSSQLIPFYGSHDTSLKYKKQIQWTDEMKKFIWSEIVAEKIKQQAEFLDEKRREESKLLWKYKSEVLPGDETNREGHAAKVYFNALFGKKFTRTDDIPINAALNYGYSILLSIFNREIVAAGYITQIGLFHDNMFNQFNLASDLMEPFRPLVDDEVIKLKPERFGKDEKHSILEILNKEVLIGSKNEVLTNAIKIYCRSVFEALNERDVSLLRFYYNEL